MAAAAALFIALTVPAFAQDYLAVDAKATTWRAGDTVWYIAGCHTAEPIIEVARSNTPEELFMINIKKALCFDLGSQQSSTLIKWIDGPYRDNTDGFIGSIWEFRHAGQSAFFWLSDKSGPHKPIKAREA